MQSDWSTRRGSFVAASVLLMIACGGGQANPEPEAASAERPKASERIEAVEPAGTCPDVSRLTVRSTNGAYPKAPPDWSAVKSVLAERTLAGLGGDSTAIVVYLANASLSLAQMKDGGLDLPASDAFVRIAFTNGAGHASAGRYRPSPEYAAEMRVDDHRAALGLQDRGQRRDHRADRGPGLWGPRAEGSLDLDLGQFHRCPEPVAHPACYLEARPVTVSGRPGVPEAG